MVRQMGLFSTAWVLTSTHQSKHESSLLGIASFLAKPTQANEAFWDVIASRRSVLGLEYVLI